MASPTNLFLVGAIGVTNSIGTSETRVQILNLPLLARTIPGGGALPLWPAPAPLSQNEALNLAAWLVAVTGRRADFLRLLDEVEST